MDALYLSYAFLFVANCLAAIAFDRWDIACGIGASVLALSAITIFYFLERLTPASAALLVLLMCGAIILKNVDSLLHRRTFYLFIGAASLLLALHKFPGIENYLVFDNAIISRSSQPFTLYANFDKGIAGAILLVAMTGYRDKPPDQYRFSALHIVIFVGLMSLLGLLAGLRPDIKLPRQTLSFFLVNAFLTCIPEEAFFRGYLFDLINKNAVFAKSHWVAIFLTAAIFGLAHVSGGWLYALISGLSGVGLGWLRFRSASISAPIFGHFLTNAVQFTLLTYPFPN